jgi:hypothetical protein
MVLLLLGLLFCWMAFLGWRRRGEDRINVIESAILKTIEAEPLPLTRLDRRLQTFHLVMLSVFGPLLAVAGLLILLT